MSLTKTPSSNRVRVSYEARERDHEELIILRLISGGLLYKTNSKKMLVVSVSLDVSEISLAELSAVLMASGISGSSKVSDYFNNNEPVEEL